MIYMNGKYDNDCPRDLKIILNRLPLQDSTNKFTMPRGNNRKQKTNVKNTVIASSEKPSQKLEKNSNNVFELSVNLVRHKNLCESINEQACGFVKTRGKCQKPTAASTKNINPKYKSDGKVSKTPKSDKLQESSSISKSTPLKKRLRKCQQTNYHESSLENSTMIRNISSLSVKPRVPIYKQKISSENKPPDQLSKDPYDLDISDSENKKQKVKKVDTSRKFNKTMFDELKRLEKNNKNSKKRVPKTGTAKTLGPYQKNINCAMKKIIGKIKEKNKASASQEENETQLSQIVTQETVDDINSKSKGTEPKASNSHCNRAICNTKNLTENQNLRYIETIQGYENNTGLLGFDCSRKKSKIVEIMTPSASKVIIIQDVKLMNNHSTTDHYDDKLDSDNGLDESYFGFCDDNMESPANFIQRRPNANSTMIGNITKSPWRMTTFLRRKPYLLSVKSTALPNLQQEMVLDHTLVEEIEKHFSKSFSETSNQKLPVQTSMLDYVESSIDHTVEHNEVDITCSSLFNYEEFNVTKPKRRVLGTLQECSLGNRQAISTPKTGNNHNTSPNGIGTLQEYSLGKRQVISTPRGNHNNLSPNVSAIEQTEKNSKISFGFDFTNNVVEKENRIDTAKPSRFNLASVKLYKNVVASNDSFEDLRENETVNDSRCSQTAIETNDSDVQLFDDIDKEFEGEMSINLPKIKYQRKTHRKRLLSDASDDEDHDRPKKKKKDMMTIAEEAAFEKWATQFNSMCEEVDQHNLEIE